MEKWIPVDKKLPPKGELVLLHTDDGNTIVGSYDLNHQGCWRIGNDTISWDFDFNYEIDIEFWMELPEDP